MPDTVDADVVSVWELICKLLVDARRTGISGAEIEEDAVYEAILAALVHHEGGVAD